VECLEDRCQFAVGFGEVVLASDLATAVPNPEASLLNPWGIAFSPTGPFWFADNGSGSSDLLDGSGDSVGLATRIPSARESLAQPTGVVFNGGPGFLVSEHGISAPSRFLFASEDGTISGWSSIVDEGRAQMAVDRSQSGAVYFGLALAKDAAGHSRLYAADFGRGTIDVFDEAFRETRTVGGFRDPALPGDFAPFNIQSIGGALFVAYAERGSNGDDVPGAGHGAIDVFNPNGQLLHRLVSGGALDSPWGMAIAPAGFGPFGGDLLVGNNGDGRIDVYAPATGSLLGTLRDDFGDPFKVPDLWAITFGNGAAGGDANTLFFAAGIDYEQHGVFGAIQSPSRRGAATAGAGSFDPNAPGEPGDYPLPPTSGPKLRSIDGQSTVAIHFLPGGSGERPLFPVLIATPSASTSLSLPNTEDRRLSAIETTTIPADDEAASLADDLRPSNIGALPLTIDVIQSANAVASAQRLELRSEVLPLPGATEPRTGVAVVPAESPGPAPFAADDADSPRDDGATGDLWFEALKLFSLVSIPVIGSYAIPWRGEQLKRLRRGGRSAG
jgi:uncharacterized protein (TIGR03118 family)